MLTKQNFCYFTFTFIIPIPVYEKSLSFIHKVIQIRLTGISTRKCLWGVECGWRVRLTASLPSMSQLSRQYGIVDISQPYKPPWPVTRIALLLRISARLTHHCTGVLRICASSVVFLWKWQKSGLKTWILMIYCL
jgi:hypothetical protein